MIPTGEATAKMNTHHLTKVKSSGKVLTKAMPRELPAMPLWTPMAITMLRQATKFICKPHASPSKKLWTDSAIMRMNGLTLQPFFLPVS